MASVADLMRSNLLEVFNEPDPERRTAVIARTYAPDVVWYESDQVLHGREALAARAAELRAGLGPGFVFTPGGPVSANHDLGHLAFRVGPADRPDTVTGMDIARCRDGVIVELYTFVNAADQAS
jgi:hypothetical protein